MSMQTNKSVSTETSRPKPSPPAATNPAILRAAEFIKKGDYRRASALLVAAGRDLQVRNTLGVCLMRLGEFEQAVQVYRQLVLMPGSVTERAEISDVYKRNFATALLLRGFPSGALEVLASMHDSESLMSARIRASIKQWERSLSFFRWLDWKLNRIEPPNCRVPIDFDPGELDFDVVMPRPDQPVRRNINLAA